MPEASAALSSPASSSPASSLPASSLPASSSLRSSAPASGSAASDVPAGSPTAAARATGAAAAGPRPVPVLYIAGSGRSGTTLIDSILGQLPGVFSAGELRFLWQRGVVENRLCGCGRAFAECPTWQAVMREALADWPELDPEQFARRQRRRVRAARLPGMLWSAWRGATSRPGRGERVLADVYAAVAHLTSARVVVDSSKLPPYGHLLTGVPGIDLRVLHVVRDPRATAFSWQRRRILPDFGDERLMHQQRPPKSATLWLLWNAVTELLWAGPRTRRPDRYLRIRYEDFVAAPEEATRRIADWLGVPSTELPFRSPREVVLAPTHSVAGNPSRHRTGPVTVRADEEWVTSMRRRDALVVTGLTWPLLLRYRYPLGRSRTRARTRSDVA